MVSRTVRVPYRVHQLEVAISTPSSSSSAPCPSCGSTDVAPIVYGLMDHETFLENPGIVPGGCCVFPEDRHCRACRTRFRSDGDDLQGSTRFSDL